MGSGKLPTPRFLGAPIKLSLNKFFDLSTPSMRKGNSGEEEKNGENREKKRLMRIVATTSLPAVNHPNDTAQTTTAGTPHARANY